MNTEHPQTLTGAVLAAEPCPEATFFTVEGCQDFAAVTLPPANLTGLGRIVQLDVTLRAICPGKRVAVSVMLYENAQNGEKQPRGVKHFLVPAQEGTGCRDIVLRCISFSVPEALNPASDGTTICATRTFEAQVIANYVDTDYVPCCTADGEIV